MPYGEIEISERSLSPSSFPATFPNKLQGVVRMGNTHVLLADTWICQTNYSNGYVELQVLHFCSLHFECSFVAQVQYGILCLQNTFL